MRDFKTEIKQFTELKWEHRCLDLKIKRLEEILEEAFQLDLVNRFAREDNTGYVYYTKSSKPSKSILQAKEEALKLTKEIHGLDLCTMDEPEQCCDDKRE